MEMKQTHCVKDESVRILSCVPWTIEHVTKGRESCESKQW